MDPALCISPNEPLNPEAEVSTTKTAVAGEKRAAENGVAAESVMKSHKRARTGAAKEAKRVAEIVLVLSAMLGMRGGGKGPTEAELRLMAEAREKLAEMCEDLAPKDILARDAIVNLIEDLGLNGRVKEQKLGFRGQRLNIKEKVELSKRKMEESKKFTTQPTTYTSHPLQTSFGATAENRGTPHTVRIFPSDKISTSPTLSSGGFPSSSVHAHATTSTSQPYQLPNHDVRVPAVSTGLPGSHLARDSSSLALPRVERQQIKLDAVSNGSSYVPQVQANVSTSYPLVNAPTWTVQPQSALLAKPGLENKVPNYISVKVEGPADMSRTAPQAARDQTFRPFITQTASGNMGSMHQASQGTNLVQASQFGNSHNEIAKIIQKLLHPRLPERPAWTPPSREYMNKALTCQICKLTANEVETVVLCDACEKGFHLKCLQINNHKGIPRGGEWHCMSCLKLSNGKPLPPKYGRVMRSINAPKMPSSAPVLQSSDKKVGPLDPKVNNQQKITINGSSTGSGAVGSNSVEFASDSKIHNMRATQGGHFVSSTKNMDQEISTGTCLSNSTNASGIVCNSPPLVSSERSTQPTQVCESSTHSEKLASEMQLQPPAILSDTISNNSDLSQPTQNSQVARADFPNCAEVSLKNYHKNNSIAKVDEQAAARPNPVGNSVISSNVLHNVEWIGDILQAVDGKIFYQSCCIDGVKYKVQDHALVHSSPNKLIPSKLQAMWEDAGTGSKWVMVNRCFFPVDLPEAVGRPCAPESNELYESNNESTVMAGLIQGPCEVLPPGKFKEKSERRNQLGNEANKGRQPLFLCQWFYDELKGVFRPVSG